MKVLVIGNGGREHALAWKLAQSLARAWQPRGVHVAHAILDGVIAGSARGGQHAARLDPDAIASCYWQLAQQPPGAWTHEMDLRGADEPF